MWDSVGIGIIIEYPTGVLISNQIGGTSCLHPKVEGIYLPLCNDFSEEEHKFLSPEIELSNYFIGDKYKGSGAVNGIDLEDVENLNKILSKNNLNSFLKIDTEMNHMKRGLELIFIQETIKT
ncbi:DUF6210 family protein [Tenacibaculum sp. M341]|uniref:DUF6210 family protein n=1 Tax=uncultured Tenacibaculum sp. TaxID=174713 RepID=UPI0010443FEE|nr:DUF6210 family protein [Tenacibaculum sp. M341]TCI85584.1 hypothetical protein EYW44_16630 [Tenacibaculum sp. M341]